MIASRQIWERDPAIEGTGSMKANGEMAAEASVSSDHGRVPVSADTRGKHRILAELKRLEQEARFLEVLLFCAHCLSLAPSLPPMICVFFIIEEKKVFVWNNLLVCN